MKARKTIKVEQIRAHANFLLALNESDEYKRGVADILTYILMKSGNYHGYNHLYWTSQGYQEWIEAGEPDFPEKNKFIYGPTGSKYSRKYY